MKVLLKQARIICSRSPFHGQVKDILIIDGIIKSIADNIQNEDYSIIESQQLHVSIGWMDLFVQFADPGYEFRETIKTGTTPSDKRYSGYGGLLLVTIRTA